MRKSFFDIWLVVAGLLGAFSFPPVLFGAQESSINVPPDHFVTLFSEHDINASVAEGWVLPNGQLPAIRAYWYQSQSFGQLDVQVLLDKETVIFESFAGIGEGQEALEDAIGNFVINDFHVMLGALWGEVNTDQISTKKWEINGKEYTAYIGNYGVRGSGEVTPEILMELLTTVEDAIKSEPLKAEVHWFRFFIGQVAGEKTIEALLDNEGWTAGQKGMQTVSWPNQDEYYSVRLFLVLRGV